MINFPVVGGTSGHLMGSVLVAALLGPAAAMVVMTAVIIVQCFLFADGGVTALGANVFNMAVLGTAGGYLVYALVSRWIRGPAGRITAVAFGGWCSVVMAATACAGQLAWSGTVSWSAAFTAMAGIHLLIGLGEGLIGALVFAAVERARPDLVAGPEASAASTGVWLRCGMVVALGLAIFLAPFACPWPDGLEAVATRLGFEHVSQDLGFWALAPDYVFPGVPWSAGATALAGILGVLIVFGLAWWLGRALVPKTGLTHEADIHTS